MIEPTKPVNWNPTSPLLDDRWRLCRKIGCSDLDKLGVDPTLLCGSLFLRHTLTDRHKMLELRNLLAQGPLPPPVCRMSDYEVFQQISELLKSGRLHLHAKLKPRVDAAAWGRGSARQDEFDITENGASTPARPGPVIEPATFVSNLDGSAQAATLKLASANGVPFCAACEAATLAGQTAVAKGPVAVAKAPVQVTVKITLEAPVACPGHPLKITAAGTPTGGDYAWTVDGAELGDASGNPLASGDTVYLKKFPAADSTGPIPESSATVSVTYTYSGDKAKDSKKVKIHGIKFVVSNMNIQATRLEVKKKPPPSSESLSHHVVFEGEHGKEQPLLQVTPKVTIQLDRSCTRWQDCAKNYRAGIIQDVTAAHKFEKYRHRKATTTLKIGPPIRDSVIKQQDPDAEIVFPFYDAPQSFDPEIDRANDTVTLFYGDSPGLDVVSNPDPNDPQNDNTLEQLILHEEFTTWLVVQNQSEPNINDSFIFLKNFRWSIDHTATRNDAGEYLPRYSDPDAKEIHDGMGDKAPSLTSETANDSKSWNEEIVDDPPPKRSPPKRKH